MTRRVEEHKGAEAMQAATGKTHDEWRALLDAAGAKDWAHKATADWLVAEHGVDPWWAQGITIDYEQARKGRVPGQRSDGSFATQKARTIPGDRLDALAAVAAVVSAQYGEPIGQNLTASLPNVRWKLEDGSKLSASAGKPNASGTPITLMHEKLAGPDAVAPAKQHLADLLESV